MRTGERGSVAPVEEAEVPSGTARRSAATPTAPSEAFLGAVGRRVRHQRRLVHMTRRQLARRSGVSERHLAQLETGQGNMSIVLLRKVAFALELPLPRLVAEEDAEPVPLRSS